MRVSLRVCAALVLAGSLAGHGKDILSDTSRIQSLTGMKGARHYAMPASTSSPYTSI